MEKIKLELSIYYQKKRRVNLLFFFLRRRKNKPDFHKPGLIHENLKENNSRFFLLLFFYIYKVFKVWKIIETQNLIYVMISIIDILENGGKIAKYLEAKLHSIEWTDEYYHKFILIHSLCKYAASLDTVYYDLIIYHIEMIDGWSNEVDLNSVSSIKTKEDLAIWLKDNLVGKIITLKRYGKNNDFVS